MSNKQYLENRKVRIARFSRVTQMTTACEVRGSLFFSRRRRSVWLARKLGLPEAADFAENICVYGADSKTLRLLQSDSAMREALATLFANKEEQHVALGGRRVYWWLRLPLRKMQEQKTANAIACLASRLEALSVGELNRELSPAQLLMPFMVFAGLSMADFFGVRIATRGCG